VLELNREAINQMCAPVSLHVVPDAGHLFEEPGALRHVVEVASEWLRTYVADPRAAPIRTGRNQTASHYRSRS
jgi:hypothetical protein